MKKFDIEIVKMDKKMTQSIEILIGLAKERINYLDMINYNNKIEIRLNGKLLMDTDDMSGQVLSYYLSGIIAGYDIKKYS